MMRRIFLKGIGAGVSIISGLPSTISLASQRSHWLPAESDPHERTFMQWPVNRAVYPDHVFLKMVQKSIADIANTVSQFEPVVILMDQKYEADAHRILSPSIEVWNISTDDLWCRDSGPTFVINKSGGLAVSHLNFNGWGNKQFHARDGKIARLVAERLELPIIDNGLVGEAGGVETDAAGTLIAHESSWIIENRNSGSKAKIEQLLLDALGAQKLIWAPGIKGADITDYHIDSLARFVDPGTVLIQLPERIDHNDRWSIAAFETYEVLKQSTDARGEKIKLVIVPEPGSPRNKSVDFVASYVNYYVCNGAVIAAQFGDEKTDAKAMAMLADLYPSRKIVTLNVDPLGEIGGGIHCATQQQPKI